MVKLAKFIVSLKSFPIIFFCLASLGIYWDPLFYIFFSLSIICSLIYISNINWAELEALTTTPILDNIISFYEHFRKI
jgi:uncharacterized membrane protein YkgB